MFLYSQQPIISAYNYVMSVAYKENQDLRIHYYTNTTTATATTTATTTATARPQKQVQLWL